MILKSESEKWLINAHGTQLWGAVGVSEDF